MRYKVLLADANGTILESWEVDSDFDVVENEDLNHAADMDILIEQAILKHEQRDPRN